MGGLEGRAASHVVANRRLFATCLAILPVCAHLECKEQYLQRDRLMKKAIAAAVLISASFVATSGHAEEVGKIGVDWVGNDILVEAVHDHEIEGVTCHLAYFDRGFFDRLSKGNWFEDPSNSSIACRVTGPVTVGDISLSKGGEEVFKEGRSFLWKKLVVKRIYDKTNNTLIYLSHTREVADGSAKMSISTVPLYGAEVTWSDKYWPSGKPE